MTCIIIVLCSVTYNSTSGKELQRLLKVPIDGYEEDILTVLRLQKYTPLVKLFDYDGRKTISLYLLQTFLDKDASITILSEVSHVDHCVHYYYYYYRLTHCLNCYHH